MFQESFCRRLTIHQGSQLPLGLRTGAHEPAGRNMCVCRPKRLSLAPLKFGSFEMEGGRIPSFFRRHARYSSEHIWGSPFPNPLVTLASPCGCPSAVGYRHNEEHPVAQRVPFIVRVFEKVSALSVQRWLCPRCARFDLIEHRGKPIVCFVGKD